MPRTVAARWDGRLQTFKSETGFRHQRWVSFGKKRGKPRSLLPENSCAMRCKKCGVGQHGIIRNLQCLSCVSAEVFSNCSLRKFVLEAWGKEQTEIVVEPNEATVERRIVQA